MARWCSGSVAAFFACVVLGYCVVGAWLGWGGRGAEVEDLRWLAVLWISVFGSQCRC